MSINRWMGKEAVVHIYIHIYIYIYTMEYYSVVKGSIWVSSNEVNKPRAYYIEWSKSEREREISYANIYMESRKIALINLFEGQQRRNRHREQTYGLGRREGGRAWDGWREYMESYNTICKIDSQWEFAAWFREHKQGLCNYRDLVGREMGGRFKREGTYAYLLILVDAWQKTTKLCKAIIFQLKNK